MQVNLQLLDTEWIIYIHDLALKCTLQRWLEDLTTLLIEYWEVHKVELIFPLNISIPYNQ
jgi:hypothetical protein